MDPNLTLAHITQNTAVIQLHQCVAFPPATLRACRVPLPSASSAETCISAAYEIGTIAQQFLQQSSGITHPQLGFCLFNAGRVLLVHAAHQGTKVQIMFATISAALQEISSRWNHHQDDQSKTSSNNNLASRLHSRLLGAQAAMGCSVTPQATRAPLDVSRSVYFEDRDRSRATSVGPTTCNEFQSNIPVVDTGEVGLVKPSVDAIQSALPSLPAMWDDILPPMWDNQANTFANYDPGADPFSVSEAPGGGEAEGGDVNFEWMSGLEGVFDENFQQVSRDDIFLLYSG